jgi:hypothetical protein
MSGAFKVTGQRLDRLFVQSALHYTIDLDLRESGLLSCPYACKDWLNAQLTTVHFFEYLIIQTIEADSYPVESCGLECCGVSGK